MLREGADALRAHHRAFEFHHDAERVVQRAAAAARADGKEVRQRGVGEAGPELALMDPI